MSWPNSVSATPWPGSTFPRPPANDNWRGPRINVPRPPVLPANDNLPRKPRGIKLPGVLRALPVFNAFVLGYTLVDWYLDPGRSELVIPAGWFVTKDCGPVAEDTFLVQTLFCGVGVTTLHRNYAADPSGSIHGTWGLFTLGRFDQWYNQNNGGVWAQAGRTFRWYGPGGHPSTDPASRPRFETAPGRAVPLQRPAVEPYPGFYPPLMNPPFPAPPPLRAGAYKAPRRIMPEWPEAGYGTKPRPKSDYLRSSRPPRGTRERKVRARDYAVGRTIEWLVSQATEGLDFQRALFEALPFWRKMQLYNAARRLEVRREAGRVVQGRLHYVDLTPVQKAQAIYDFIDEIDVAQAIENVVKQQLTDMFWAEIGQRMGRYQVGPWDDHGYQGPETEPDWQDYIPDIEPDTAHNHWVYETTANRRLSREEAYRIFSRFDNYVDQPHGG